MLSNVILYISFLGNEEILLSHNLKEQDMTENKQKNTT